MSVATLFTEDFLAEGIKQSPAWKELSDEEVAAIRSGITEIFAQVADKDALNEAQTQHRIIEPILELLGWAGTYSVQTNIERRQRPNVSDYSFFADQEAFAKADGVEQHDLKLRHAVAVGDAKKWSIGLDRSGGGAGVGETPSAQIIRYLTRSETVSDRAVRWAVLTNGQQWRLYFSGARSLLDGYFETNLAWLVGLPGTQGELDTAEEGETEAELQDRLFRTFVLMFRRVAFTPSTKLGNKTFPEFAFDEGRLWETKVRTNLSDVVFNHVYPGLIRGLASIDSDAPEPLTPVYLNRVREAAFAMLYRLLFALYAEDRGLLPTRDSKFDDYALSSIRDDIARRRDQEDTFSSHSTRYWDHCVALFRIVDVGEPGLGIPPYNGGLFSETRAPIIESVRLSDAVFAPLLDMLSRTVKDDRTVRINFRDLSVRELGAIYEGLLEHEPVADPDAQLGIAVRPNPFSRKSSGSYYTPDELVSLIVERTIGPLVKERMDAFTATAKRLATDTRSMPEKLHELVDLDPAAAILELKICDPAMGSGHFLVSLIDYLAEQVFTATGEATDAVLWTDYQSPVLQRLATIRDRITGEAETNGWTVRPSQLTDANLVKRMVLKRCVFGVDKNPMAVELAKLALWLHTFTTGAPLSFLDHHLKCGDSLFGEKVGRVFNELSVRGSFLINDVIRTAEAGVRDMRTIENYTDAEIAEVKASAEAFEHIEERTGPLRRFLDFWQAIRWLDLTDSDQRVLDGLLDGQFGDPVTVAAGIEAPKKPKARPKTMLLLDDQPKQPKRKRNGVVPVQDYNNISVLIERAHTLAAEEHFLHWEVAFPGVWQNWENENPDGGFDAIVGNPPWDKLKMQQVEWFAARDPNIAGQPRAADRKAMIRALINSRSSLGASFELARARVEKTIQRARQSGDFPLLARGDINIYSLFVERAQALIKPTGIAGLLTPSGIASDLTASVFFKGVAEAGRIHCLFDFENRGRWFSDVHRSFKFCTFVVGAAERTVPTTQCGFFLETTPDAIDSNQLFEMTAADFALVNPNTGTAPIFRTRRDAELTTAIYNRLPVLVDRSTGVERKAWPVSYSTMFHMTNDSHLFWTQERLEQEGAYPVEASHWRKGTEEWVPLYVGRMMHQFNHRAASVRVNEENVHNAALSADTTSEELTDPDFSPTPQYWVRSSDIPDGDSWSFSFRDIARSTDERTAIGTIIPTRAAGNTLPLIAGMNADRAVLYAGHFGSLVLDYIARQKNQSTHLNWYIVEQLPIVPIEAYSRVFGKTTAEALVRDHVLRLTYTAQDMAPFARDMGYDGEPYIWNEEERRHLRARLDALYFHLYGITDEADIRYILSTFLIVERKDRAAWDGVYMTAELIIWYFRALAAGDTESKAPEATLLRQAERAD